MVGWHASLCAAHFQPNLRPPLPTCMLLMRALLPPRVPCSVTVQCLRLCLSSSGNSHLPFVYQANPYPSLSLSSNALPSGSSSRIPQADQGLLLDYTHRHTQTHTHTQTPLCTQIHYSHYIFSHRICLYPNSTLHWTTSLKDRNDVLLLHFQQLAYGTITNCYLMNTSHE